MKTLQNILFITFSVFSAILLLAGSVNAQTTSATDPVHIEADRMVSKQKENAVIFMGNVAASQGELTIHADEMTVSHQKNKENLTRSRSSQQEEVNPQIKKLHAVGNVKIVTKGLVATGNDMVFFADKRKVVITGNTKVWQDNNLVTGEKIELDLNTDTTIIEPDTKSGGRVKAFFYPGEEKKK